MFRDYISKIVASDERLVKLESAINEEAMQISVLVRLSPIVPDELLNYVMSSSPVSIRVFFLSNLSSIVYSFAYAYFHLSIELIPKGSLADYLWTIGIQNLIKPTFKILKNVC